MGFVDIVDFLLKNTCFQPKIFKLMIFTCLLFDPLVQNM